MISDISPEVTLPSQQCRIESVLWHPVANNVLTVTSHTVVKLFDVTQGTDKCCKYQANRPFAHFRLWF